MKQANLDDDKNIIQRILILVFSRAETTWAVTPLLFDDIGNYYFELTS